MTTAWPWPARSRRCSVAEVYWRALIQSGDAHSVITHIKRRGEDFEVWLDRIHELAIERSMDDGVPCRYLDRLWYQVHGAAILNMLEDR